MRILLMALPVMVFASTARAEAPAEVAKKLIDAQIAALRLDETNAATAALEKLFDKEGPLVAPNGEMGTPATSLVRMPEAILGEPQNRLAGAKVASLVAGGDAKVVWISAEVELEVYNRNAPKSKPHTTRAFRVTEVAVAGKGGWKIGAAIWGIAGSPKRSDTAQLGIIAVKPKQPTLTSFVIDPAKLAFQLPANDSTVVVYGTDKREKAVGSAAAKKLLESWKSLKLEIDGDVHEIDGTTYGYILANVNWVKPGGPPYRMRALVIATRDTSQPWVFRAIQYAVY